MRKENIDFKLSVLRASVGLKPLTARVLAKNNAKHCIDKEVCHNFHHQVRSTY